MTQARILVVDDDPLVHEVLEGYLGLSGYEVAHAHNGQEGLEKLLQLVPDLLIADVQMPVLDGFGLLQRMKSNPLLGGIPVIMLSSLERPNIKVKALQLGADDYVVKPFDQSELMARVAVMLRRRDLQRDMEAVFSGVLGPVTLVELLQTMAHGDKSGKIELPDMDAEIFVGAKQLISCRWRVLDGIEAFRRILLEETGRFRIHFEQTEADDALGSVEDLLLSTLVFMDEFKAAFGELLREELKLEPGKLLPALSTVGGVEINWPIDGFHLVLSLAGSVEENAELVREMISSQLLNVEIDEGNE